MAGYCTIDQVIKYIPGLRVDSSPDVSSGVIQGLIDGQLAEIKNVASNKLYSLPTPTETPTTNRELLLYLLNVESVVAEIILRRAGNVNGRDRFIAETQKRIADKNFLDFSNGHLYLAFKSTLPTDQLGLANDAAAYASGFPLSESTNPSTSLVQFWCDAESAYIHAMAARRGYVTSPYASMSDTRKNIYSGLVVEKVGAHVVRMRAQQFSALNASANSILINAEKNRDKFRSKGYDNTLGR